MAGWKHHQNATAAASGGAKRRLRSSRRGSRSSRANGTEFAVAVGGESRRPLRFRIAGSDESLLVLSLAHRVLDRTMSDLMFARRWMRDALWSPAMETSGYQQTR